MTASVFCFGRRKKGWTQKQAAAKLGVSQSYLSLLEKGERSITEDLARKATKLYQLSVVALPIQHSPNHLPPSDEQELAFALASLGYPGFAHLKARGKKNPAEVLASLLQSPNLDGRLTEALPWILLTFPDLDWQWLIQAAKLHDLQNRLGFITNVAWRIAQLRGEKEKVALLAQQEKLLERSRLAREDTLCHSSLTQAEKRWLRESRSEAARHWRLLTDLSPEHMNYGR